MADNHRFAAELLERSAAAYAAEAAALMRAPESIGEFAVDPVWKRHLVQRVLELSAAVANDEPALFIARVRWSRKAFSARGHDEAELVASLRALARVLERQLPPAAGATALDTLARAIEALGVPRGHEAADGLDPSRPADRLALTYLNLVLEGNVTEAIARLVQASANLSLEALYLQVLMPAQREIGTLWQLGDLSIPEEHLVTTTTQRAMSILSHAAPRAALNGRTVVVAAVAGNTHDLSLRAAADLLECAGWRALLLGADVPPEDLPTVLNFFEADLLVLGAMLSTQLRMLTTTVEGVRAYCERDVRILVGGSAFDEAPDVWKKLGVDAYARTLGEVTIAAESLLGVP